MLVTGVIKSRLVDSTLRHIVTRQQLWRCKYDQELNCGNLFKAPPTHQGVDKLVVADTCCYNGCHSSQQFEHDIM